LATNFMTAAIHVGTILATRGAMFNRLEAVTGAGAARLTGWVMRAVTSRSAKGSERCRRDSKTDRVGDEGCDVTIAVAPFPLTRHSTVCVVKGWTHETGNANVDILSAQACGLSQKM
jgi:hypothetical protein